MKTITANEDIYNLFYSKITNDVNFFPRISELYELFSNINEDDFIELAKAVMASGEDVSKQFFYFVILFRNMKNIRLFINSDKADFKLTEHLVMFGYSYCVFYDYSLEYVLDNMLSFINDKKLLALILESENIANDKLLLFFILSKFDVDILNKYFATIKDIPALINYFVRLPEKILRSIVSRNYRLFQYIMIMMAEGDHDSMVDANFFNKYRKDIEMFSSLNDLIRAYKQASNPATCAPEMNQPTSSKRITYLVNMLKSTTDVKRAIEYFNSEKIYKNEKEKTIVTAIALDPFLKDIYRNETDKNN